MNYYNEIKDKLIKSEIYDKVRDYIKERNKVITYYEIGELLSKAGKEYGKNIIKQYSEKLVNEVVKKYNERNLHYMRKFYEIFSNEKLNALRSILTWTHYRNLIRLKNVDEIIYYINISQLQKLSERKLMNKIKSHEYEKLPENVKNKLINNEKPELTELIKNPIPIKSYDIDKNNLTEYALKQLIIINMDSFLQELGDGFCYIGNEYPIKLGNRYNYIDLLLFNYEYNCFVVIELKVTELKKEHIGQIEVYMNYIDTHVKKVYHDKTIGIIICKRDNHYVIEYASDKRIISRTYELVNN